MPVGIVQHKPTFIRWSAAVFGDYEKVINAFLRHKDWDFGAFKAIAKFCYVHILHYSALGRARETPENQDITTILIQTAHDFWLRYPLTGFFDNNTLNDDYSARPAAPDTVKSMIAGFYLTYFMFKTRVETGTPIQILLDARDRQAVEYFKVCVAGLEQLQERAKQSINYLMYDLLLSEAFCPAGESRKFGIDLKTRLYYNSVEAPIAKERFQESSYGLYLSYELSSNTMLQEMRKLDLLKQKLMKKAVGALSGGCLSSQFAGRDFGATPSGSSRKTPRRTLGPGYDSLSDFVQKSSKSTVATMAVAPAEILTYVVANRSKLGIQDFLGEEAVGRIMMQEASKLAKAAALKREKQIVTTAKKLALSQGFNYRSYIAQGLNSEE